MLYVLLYGFNKRDEIVFVIADQGKEALVRDEPVSVDQ